VVHGVDWPAVATGRPAEIPLVVVRADRVIARSPAAAAEGVQVGHRRRQAQAQCPQVEVVDHDPARDARAFEPVVRAVGELVPFLEVGDPGRLTLATRGPSRIVGGDEALADRLLELASSAVPGSGAVWGVGLADGRFAATLAAHGAAAAGRPVVVPPGVESTRGFLGPHPVRSLTTAGGVAPELVELLERLGLRRLAEVAALRRADLLGRFGALGDTLHRLASGADDRPPAVASPPPELAVDRVFDDPVPSLDVLVFVAKQLAETLVASLRATGQVCVRLLVEAETEHGERTSRSWYRADGLTAAAMVERVRWQLDGWATQPGGLSGGVVLLRLAPQQVRADVGRQGGFWGGTTQADEGAARAITRLLGVLGPEAVTVAEWRGGRDPRRVYELVSAATADVVERAAAPVDLTAHPAAGPWPGRLPRPSPAVVHLEPRPVEVRDRQGRVVRVSGRGLLSEVPAQLVIGSAVHEIAAWAGPWPVEERWWQASGRRAARFQVVVASGRAHLVEVAGGQWWLTADYA
jgi:protein ImuB